MRTTEKNGGAAGRVGAEPLLVLAKTDALGDQILATGLVADCLEARPDARIVWFVRAGNESLATLLDGAGVWKGDPEAQPARQAVRALKAWKPDQRLWSRLLVVPVPINPYQPQPEGIDRTLKWWGGFARRLHSDLALVGSTTRNWLDQFLVSCTKADQRIGFGPSFGSQESMPEEIGRRRANFARLTEEIPFDDTTDEAARLQTLATAASGRQTRSSARISPPAARTGISPERLEHSLVIAPGVGDSRRKVETSTLAGGIAGFLATTTHFEGRCLLIEGPVDREVVSNLSRSLRQRDLSVSRFKFGPEDLPRLAALLQNTPLLLTHETFYVQLAALFGTPTVALWGLGHWKRFFPKEANMTIVHTTMPCAGCEWNCLFDRWKCIRDLPATAITGGLALQWERKASRKIQFLNTPPPMPDSEVLDAVRKSGRDAVRLQAENQGLRLWIDQLTKRTRDLESWAEAEKSKRMAAESHHDGAAEQRDRIKKLLEEAESQRDEQAGIRVEEARLRQVAEDLRQEAERQRDETRAWAEEEQRLRLVAERLLREAETQRDDAQTQANEAERLRTELEVVLRETEAQRDSHLAWAEDERRLRTAAEALAREIEKQRKAATVWAHEEKSRREAIERVLGETEEQLESARSWAAQEQELRVQAESIRLEAEQQIKSLTAWAEQERELRSEATSNRKATEAQRDQATRTRIEAEKQRDEAIKWARDEKTIREDLERVLRETEQQRGDALKWAHEEKSIRENLERVLRETEKQRSDAQDWAREERRIRESLADVLADAEKQRDDLTAWAREEKSLRQQTETDLKKARNQIGTLEREVGRLHSEIRQRQAVEEKLSGKLALLRFDLEEMTRLRDRYERLGLCRFTVKTAETFSRKPKQ